MTMRRIAFFAALLLFAFPAVAASRLEEDPALEQQAQLSHQAEKLHGELADLQQELVKVAKATQQSDNDLSAEEDRLRILNDQVAAKNKELAAEHASLSALVEAALRLSRTPPEAIVMMPGNALETMTAARALNMTAKSIHRRMKSIGLQLAELDRLKDKVTAHREALEQEQKALKAAQRQLTARLAARQALWNKVDREQAAGAEKLAENARKAENIHGLFSSLTGGSAQGVRGKLRSFLDAMGHIRLPAAGSIVQLFGHSQSENETSHGIVIATRNDAPVIAPYDGEVVFTGPFRGYGQLVILRHSDHFHTLLSGLKTINVNVGQFLLEGEPIGAMGDTQSSSRLYVELRKDNQPVDPSPWMGIK